MQERIKQMIAQHLGVDESKIVPEASFEGDLGADSLDTIELVMAFEESFGIEISDDIAKNITTIQDAIDCIQERESRTMSNDTFAIIAKFPEVQRLLTELSSVLIAANQDGIVFDEMRLIHYLELLNVEFKHWPIFYDFYDDDKPQLTEDTI